ncbi:NmrA family transcriptional regulator [Penicillium herquei]|nr:NmrA family transcriptional regulator [Penicillium herquei]
MKRTIVVFGTTGNQGGSVIDHILNDAELSSRYHVRSVTRDPNSQAAKGLRNRGVEVTIADMDRPNTIERALIDANFAFILTSFQTTKDHEIAQGKKIFERSCRKQLGIYYI